MTYTLRKAAVGQEVLKKLTFFVNACKFSMPPYSENEYFQALDNYSSSYTGVALANITTTLRDLWSPETTLYAKSYTTGEIIKITITTTGQITIVSRQEFGTSEGTISDLGVFQIIHSGRADRSCYGYSQTCSNANSFDPNLFKEIVFATAVLPAGSMYHGGLDFKALTYSSSELKPGEAMASRSRISFKISDQIHNDYNFVPWPEQRTNAGTLFGKLLARNPYFNERPIKYSIGLRDAGKIGEPDWEHRTLIIDNVNLSDDVFTGTALDPLILTEGKKAKMPLASPAQLTTGITSGSTNVIFGNAPLDYFGTSGNLIVRIDSELIEVTADGTTSMPIVNRGVGGSIVRDHAVNATVQNCIQFINEHVVDAITYAISTWTNTPASFIDDYSATIALNPSAIISDYIISTPTDVIDFINRCIFIGNLSSYFDDVNQKIVIKYVTEWSANPVFLDNLNTIRKESGKINLNYGEQWTRFNMSWAPYDQTKDTDLNNYQTSLTAINLDLESPSKRGQVNEKKSMLMPLLTASSSDYLLGAAAVNRVVDESQEIPDIFECELDAESVGDTQGSKLELGSVVSINSRSNQSKAGVALSRLYQVLKIDGDAFQGFRAKFKRFQSYIPSPADYDYAIDPIPNEDYINYVLTDHFSPSTPGQYTVYIREGCVFGSYDTTIAAFRTGTPAAGVTFKFIARWQVMGMGGAGGNAATLLSSDYLAEDGGLAFEANCDVEIDNSVGVIWAGGGGGDGQVYIPPQGPFSTLIPRLGGGGGQGYGIAFGGAHSDGEDFNGLFAPDGNLTGYGEVLNGHDGGAWGSKGEFELSRPSNAGIAVKSNGFNVTFTAGDNALAIRGRRT